jgi:putative ABC transport system permease protein
MDLLKHAFRRFKALFTRRALDEDMNKEMRLHLELLAKEYEDSGMPPQEARRVARRRFGNVARIKEEGRDIRGAGILEGLLRDAHHALRGFRRSPVFTATVILMLALGIGANTAIFSIVDRLLIRDLPYPDGEQLMMVYESTASFPRNNVSPANWMDWQGMSQSFEFLAAWNSVSSTVTGEGEPELLLGQTGSVEFFPALRVQPFFGRTFVAQDYQPNSSRVVILSHRLWQRRFGDDRAVIGKEIDLDANAHEVIGVMPPDFYFVSPDTDFWVPYLLDRDRDWRATSGRIMLVMGRLKPSVSPAAAQAEMGPIAARLEKTHAFNQNTSVAVVPLREILTGQVRASLLVLFGAVGVLLLIACFNVASMMLARAASRRREMAVRSSLGAGRGVLLRQLLVESSLLALAGGTAGFFVATWAVGLLLAWTPRTLLRVTEVPLDARVLLYALALSVVTGFIFGAGPAFAATRNSLSEALREGGRSLTRSARLRQGLLITQVAMTVLLLCGAGLLLRSFAALNGVRTGVDAPDVLTMQVSLPAARYNRNQQVAFAQGAIERLRGLPGVEAAGAARSIPVMGPTAGTGVHIQGTQDVAMNERPMARVRSATPGYFATLGIPVVRGRDFNDGDLKENAEPVFIVNDAFARTHLAGRDPLETTIKVFMSSDNPYARIIGVVADVNEGSIRNAAAPTVFYNLRQLTYSGITLFVRGREPSSLMKTAAQAIRDLDPNLPVTQVRTLQQAFGLSIARERLNAIVSGAFALTAMLLASLGLYGLLAFLVAERTREIGIRIALGAKASSVLRMVMHHGLRLVLCGAVLGLATALAVSRWIRSLLFGITPYDPLTFAAVIALLVAVSALAAFVPARRATKVDPAITLRQE